MRIAEIPAALRFRWRHWRWWLRTPTVGRFPNSRAWRRALDRWLDEEPRREEGRWLSRP